MFLFKRKGEAESDEDLLRQYFVRAMQNISVFCITAISRWCTVCV